MDDLKEAVLFLAGRCDYARMQDGEGFNRFDTDFGHKLAGIAEAGLEWSPKQTRAAWKMVRKYREQLGNAGIDFDAIPEPPDGKDFPMPHSTSYEFKLTFGKHKGRSLGELEDNYQVFTRRVNCSRSF